MTDRRNENNAMRAVDRRGLDDRKRLAAALLVSGLPKKEVARRVGVDQATLWRWERDEGFAAYRAQLSRDVLDETLDAARSAAYLSVLAVRDRALEGDADVALRFLGLVGAGRIQLESGGAPDPNGSVQPELPEGK